jgi:hypothetical protein
MKTFSLSTTARRKNSLLHEHDDNLPKKLCFTNPATIATSKNPASRIRRRLQY